MYIDPYEKIDFDQKNWKKANFHSHAGTEPNTCGKHEISRTIELYKEAGYEILTISNHDLYSDVSDYEKKYKMLMMNGFEYSLIAHMLCINVNNIIKGKHQYVINESKKQGGFVILCHPNWQTKEYWSVKEMNELNGFAGIEIFNSLIFRLKGSGSATDKWDDLFSRISSTY